MLCNYYIERLVFLIVCFFLLIAHGGCQNTFSPSLSGMESDWDLTSSIKRPNDQTSYEKVMTVVIESDPPGVAVYAVSKNDSGGFTPQQSLGTTPLEIPFRFCMLDNLPWFRDPALLNGHLDRHKEKGMLSGNVIIGNLSVQLPERADYWSPVVHQSVEIEPRSGGGGAYISTPYLFQVNAAKDLRIVENKLVVDDTCGEYSFTLSLRHPDCYEALIYTGFRFEKGRTVQIIGSHARTDLRDDCSIQPYGFPIRLVKHGSVFSSEMAVAVNQSDYYRAEEMRLQRIDQLEEQVRQNKDFWSGESVPELHPTAISRIHLQLANSELMQLKYLVGLLDPQLMGLRKQLLEQLKGGDIEASFALAKAVESMEKRYFPTPPPEKIIVQGLASQPEYTNSTQNAGKQEIVIQQKPYYGATNILQAISAMRGDKLDPEAYRKALGGAQLADIMGFGDFLNR